MIRSNIFIKFYQNNKKWILAYLTLCMIFSLFAYGTVGGNQASAQSTTEVVSTLGGNFGVAAIPLIQNFCSAIDTPTTLLLMSAISLSFELIPDEKIAQFGQKVNIAGLEDYSFGILDYHWFKIFILSWFIISKISRSNRISYTAGVILEDIENKLGGAVQFLCVAVQVFANVPTKSTVYAADLTTTSRNLLTNGIDALTCFLILMILLATFFFVRILFYAVDISACVLCSLIPFTGVSMEIIKSCFVAFLLYMALFHPVIFYGTAGLIVLVAILLFKRTYTTLCYFKKIYIKPIFRRIRGFDEKIPLISNRVPRKVQAFTQQDNPCLIIPVYPVLRIAGFKKLHKYERWWLVSGENRQYICKPRFFGKGCHILELHSDPEHKIFIKKSVRFFEVFILKGTEEKLGKTFHWVKKRIHFVFSREYTRRYEEIKDITKWVDYTEYVGTIKKEAKEAKRQALEEARAARKFTNI